MSVVGFTGGKRCRKCDEQIDPKRVIAAPGAIYCRDCQDDRDLALKKAVNTLGQCSRGREIVSKRASITIKW